MISQTAGNVSHLAGGEKSRQGTASEGRYLLQASAACSHLLSRQAAGEKGSKAAGLLPAVVFVGFLLLLRAWQKTVRRATAGVRMCGGRKGGSPGHREEKGMAGPRRNERNEHDEIDYCVGKIERVRPEMCSGCSVDGHCARCSGNNGLFLFCCQHSVPSVCQTP